MLLSDIGEFLYSVFINWLLWTGGALMLVISILERIFSKDLLGKRGYLTILSVFVVLACFSSWRNRVEQARERDAAFEKLSDVLAKRDDKIDDLEKTVRTQQSQINSGGSSLSSGQEFMPLPGAHLAMPAMPSEAKVYYSLVQEGSLHPDFKYCLRITIQASKELHRFICQLKCDQPIGYGVAMPAGKFVGMTQSIEDIAKNDPSVFTFSASEPKLTPYGPWELRLYSKETPINILSFNWSE